MAGNENDQTVRMTMTTTTTAMMMMAKMLIGINFTKQLLSLAQSVSCIPFRFSFHSVPFLYAVSFHFINIIFVILPLLCIIFIIFGVAIYHRLKSHCVCCFRNNNNEKSHIAHAHMHIHEWTHNACLYRQTDRQRERESTFFGLIVFSWTMMCHHSGVVCV